MNRARTAALLLAFLGAGGVSGLAGEGLQIGIIDFYGLGRVSESAARAALTFKEGEAISLEGDGPQAFLAESERRLSRLPGVTRAQTELVCCEAGRGIVYVGLEEQGRPALRFRPVPRGTERLSADVLQAGEDLDKTWMEAVRGGTVGEDRSQGHSLLHDPATRAVQERFVGYAARDLKRLRRVLRNSSDAEQRALAAQVLGYVRDKQAIVDDLVYGMSDPSAEVRNNAMRALAVFASVDPSAGHPIARVPFKPFLALLHSLVWKDRNKASWALMELSARRDPALLGILKRDARATLIEMARWKSLGHATPALTILGRIGGQSDDAIVAALSRGDREAIIEAALTRRSN
jgi:hypothetical protein